MQKIECFDCSYFTAHLQQCIKCEEYEQELDYCTALLSTEGNEKENDFQAKNKVLREYKMIDDQNNVLYKGKVAKAVASVDSILMTQLLFSGSLKKLNDEEMLALLSCMIFNIRASKQHPVLDTEISPAFWEACLAIEKETVNLIEVE
jgi:superfamily II RNA helicase